MESFCKLVIFLLSLSASTSFVTQNIRRKHHTWQRMSEVPSGEPLHYITPQIIAQQAFGALRDAAVPGNLDTLIAVGIAEAIAGVVGGLASRGIANVIGDKKIDNALLKGATTGVFFGTRSVFRVFFTILGVPRPVVGGLSSFFSSIASEAIKVYGRHLYSKGLLKSEMDIARMSAIVSTKLKFESTISTAELVSDISKWLIFDSVLSLSNNLDAIPPDMFGQFVWYSGLGGISAIAGNYIRDVMTTSNDTSLSLPLQPASSGERYSRAGLEGAALFSCYQVCLQLLQHLVPAKFGNQEFLFSVFLDQLQSEAELITNSMF